MANDDGHLEYAAAYGQVNFLCSRAACGLECCPTTTHPSPPLFQRSTAWFSRVATRNIRRSQTAPYLSPTHYRFSIERIPKILRRIHISDQAFSHFDANLQPDIITFLLDYTDYLYPKLLKCTHDNQYILLDQYLHRRQWL
ncbi:Protein of unknown function [Pyronema omphalodes CBS 100304]|uniref:Uncharacterized protein n=1 Tax=Pyronema omphalodes (strain CBS 100304) TaxID=1076935 RepID=U4LF56_PYROM|nr:Protein of unknown function [Pyronema omphalodes CBS 100304]